MRLLTLARTNMHHHRPMGCPCHFKVKTTKLGLAINELAWSTLAKIKYWGPFAEVVALEMIRISVNS